LERSNDGEFLDVLDGTMRGGAAGLIFTAGLTGRLDCRTNELEADTTGGTFGIFPFSGTFSGTLSAALDPRTRILTGNWSLVAAGSNLPCTGPWSAAPAL
jgi:hypothetical protein